MSIDGRTRPSEGGAGPSPPTNRTCTFVTLTDKPRSTPLMMLCTCAQWDIQRWLINGWFTPRAQCHIQR